MFSGNLLFVGKRQSCSDNSKTRDELLGSPTCPEERECSHFHPEALERILGQDDSLQSEKGKAGRSQK